MRSPLVRRAAGSGNVGEGDRRERLEREARLERLLQIARPVDAERLHAVADEARHRHAAVLDLRLAEEADRRRVRIAPELAAREVERVEEADNRVELRLRQAERGVRV